MDQRARREHGRRGRERKTIEMSPPLAIRLPNPPAVFVGREKETKALRAALARGRVAVVAGLGGLGKTSLVLSTIHRHFPERVRSTVMVAFPPDKAPAEVSLDLARALVLGARLKSPDWTTLVRDQDGLFEMAIDIAEARRLWVVLDNVPHAAEETGRTTLLRLARFAREARWIATTRDRPDAAELLPQTVTVGALGARALHAIAKALAPDLRAEVRATAVARAAGSPWRLRRALASGLDAETTGDDPLLSTAIPEEARELATVLLLFDRPIQIDVLRQFARVPDGKTLAAIEARGIIENRSRGIRLHDVARPILLAERDPRRLDEARKRLAAPLSRLPAPDLAVEGFRLLLATGEMDEAVRLLADRGDELARAGFEPEILALLEPVRDARFARYRLRYAVDLGDPSVLASLDPPESPDIEDQLSLARRSFLSGRIIEGAKKAERLLDEAACRNEASLALEAALLASLCRGLTGEIDAAIRVLERFSSPPDTTAAARREGLLALWLLLSGDVRRALELAGSAAIRLGEVDITWRQEVGGRVALVLAFAGRVSEAARILDLALATTPRDAATHFRSREALGWSVHVDVLAGRLDRARKTLDRLEPFGRGFSAQTPYVWALEVEWALAAGAFRGLDEKIEELWTLAEVSQNSSICGWVIRFRGYHAIATVSPETALAWPSQVAPPTGPDALHVALIEHELRMRRGERSVGAALDLVRDEPALVDARVVAETLHAIERVLGGDFGGAVEAAREASDLARANGLAFLDLAARVVLCDALLIDDRRDDLRKAAEGLQAEAERFHSPRFSETASFYLAAAVDAPDPAALDRLAGLIDVAPLVAWRARALLGDEGRQDAVDRLVVRALRARGFVVERIGESRGEWRAGWGIDFHLSAVWRPGAERVDLSNDRILFKILTVLSERNGSATKEELARGVWGTRDYHRLRDDKRLQVAVGRLRRLIEHDPADPSRIVTTGTGYAFGTAESVRRLVRG